MNQKCLLAGVPQCYLAATTQADYDLGLLPNSTLIPGFWYDWRGLFAPLKGVNRL
jgi:hypothetical protein